MHYVECLGALPNRSARAMAHASQYLEGVACLLRTIRLSIGVPSLYCDNRATVHLTAGSSERRTKALVNKIMGVRSLIELGLANVTFAPTSDAQTDFLTKFTPAKVITRQRQLAGIASWSESQSR